MLQVVVGGYRDLKVACAEVADLPNLRAKPDCVSGRSSRPSRPSFRARWIVYGCVGGR